VHHAAGEDSGFDGSRDRAGCSDRVDRADVVLVPVLDPLAVREVDTELRAEQG
jgi:hypothetical protein